MAQCAHCGVEVSPGDIFLWPDEPPQQFYCSHEHALLGPATPKMGENEPKSSSEELPEHAPSPAVAPSTAKRRAPRAKKVAKED